MGWGERITPSIDGKDISMSLYCIIVQTEITRDPDKFDNVKGRLTPTVNAYANNLQASKKKLREIVDIWIKEQGLRSKFLGFDIVDHDDRRYVIHAKYSDAVSKMTFEIGRVMARDDS